MASAVRLTSVMFWPKAVTASQNDSSERTISIVQPPPAPCRTRHGTPSGCSVRAGQEMLQIRFFQPQLAKPPRLDLADTLAGDADLGADLLERCGIAVVQAEPGLDHPSRAFVQSVERLLQLLPPLRAGHLVGGLLGVHVLHHVGEQRLAVADRGLEGN